MPDDNTTDGGSSTDYVPTASITVALPNDDAFARVQDAYLAAEAKGKRSRFVDFLLNHCRADWEIRVDGESIQPPDAGRE